MEDAAGTTEYLLGKVNQKFEEWKKGWKTPKASAGKREAPANPKPAPAPRLEASLEMYHEGTRRARAYLAGTSRLDPRR